MSSTKEDPPKQQQKLPRCQPLSLTIPPSVVEAGEHPPSVVIAHRGASAHLPEHSLEGYRLALELGADYIEPDLLVSKDGHLIAMHSMDLSITTNVEEVFGNTKNKTASKYLGGKQDSSNEDVVVFGYWAYDFTLAELKQLRLKQRLGQSPHHRSSSMDGLFQIPTLTEILELLKEWNEQIQPLWYNDGSISRPARGVYAEFKDVAWIQTDAGQNLVDVFFDHIFQHQDLWEATILKHLCHTKRLREHEYRLPPLVLQSFEVDALQNFTLQWEKIAHKQSDLTGNATGPEELTLAIETPIDTIPLPEQEGGLPAVPIPIPIPPTILLVSKDKCKDEGFWFEMGDVYRKQFSGIGPDKMCFLSREGTNEDGIPIYKYDPTLMEEAEKLNWVVHAWTERPESEFFLTSAHDDDTRRKLSSNRVTPFRSALEEIQFLKCTVKVHGVFSESVDIALRAMNLPCRDGQRSKPSSSSSCHSKTETHAQGIPLGPIILFSFVSGILVALLLLKYCPGGNGATRALTGGNRSESDIESSPEGRQQSRRNRRFGRRTKGHSAVPTNDDDTNDYEREGRTRLDDDDHEML